jgi:ketosteroid isomerase-like protein
MRRKVGWLVALAVLGSGVALARARTLQSPVNPAAARASVGQEPSEAILAVLIAQQAAWNRGDIPAFLEGYWDSPELTFSGSDGIVRGYAGLLESYRNRYPNRAAMGELDFSGLEIRPLAPDAALVLGRWHLARSLGDTGGVFTLVFRRFPTGWRIIHDHTSARKLTP